jgi:AMMECR1 domain-containing protein
MNNLQNNFLLLNLFCNIFGLPIDVYKNISYEFSSTIHRDTFGVFVTIERKFNILDNEYNVHGCIGHIDKNLFHLSIDELYESTISVGKSAAFEDSRKNQFVESIMFDPFANISISFLLLPVYIMNPEHSNNEYGLICRQGNQSTTFLPKVFPNKKLGQIQNNLMSKANTNYCDQWLEYKILYIHSTFENIMYEIFKTQKLYFIQFMNQYFKNNNFIFYEITSKQEFIINENETIRNMACINLILELDINNRTRMILEQNKLKLQEMTLKKNKNKSGLQELIAVTDNQNKYLCKKNRFQSIKNLNFTLGQYGIYYADHCRNIRTEENIIYKLLLYINNNKKNNKNKYNLVFTLNWFSQFLYHSNISTWEKLSLKNIIKNKLLKIIYENKNFINLETNYLAVSFEALCFLYLISKKQDTEILQVLFYLFIHLEKRCIYNCLFVFFDNTARLDISCHVWNGIINLINFS